MSTSHKLVCHKYDKNPSKGKIKLQTITNRKATYKTLATIDFKNWSDKKEIVLSGEPSFEKINQKIKEALLKAQTEKVYGCKIDKLIDYSEKRINSIYSYNTRRSKTNALNKLKEFRREFKKFQDINRDFTRSFYNYMQEHHAAGTAREYFVVIKYFIKEAVDEKVIEVEGDPFKNVTKRIPKTRYQVINDTELKKFLGHTFEDENRNLTQHSFKFMMFAAGMRISDFLHLTWNNFTEIHERMNIRFKMKKTGNIKETKLTLKALESLVPFLRNYNQFDLNTYHYYKKRAEKASNDLRAWRQESSQIDPDGFISVDLLNNYSQNAYIKFQEDSEKHSAKVKVKKDLDAKIETMEQLLPQVQQDVYKYLASSIKSIKTDYSTERVYPFLRGLKGNNLIRETRKRATKNNYFLNEMRKELNIKNPLSNHQARHVFAQRLFEAGANFHDISIELGHKSLAVTENYRKQISSEKSKDVVQIFTQSLDL
ncbi:tyrosine-type recombinase/integrase [Christiangramia sp. SM2212]|uniref:Tyrosine-type recombinase/integrase n=1 Tax=Christiangramia sediminicola TaxID=3073267 RepID=A0ABU1ES43_9FLAO|nr:tyrosine-type recombinase/integrase [Christiangramia sp. SM2212]MDR5590799.1 tyrosine-type recombinase/integrase [Christiangramia sp. SM2212]